MKILKVGWFVLVVILFTAGMITANIVVDWVFTALALIGLIYCLARVLVRSFVR